MLSLCNFSVPMNHLLSNLFLKYTSTFVQITVAASTICRYHIPDRSSDLKER